MTVALQAASVMDDVSEDLGGRGEGEGREGGREGEGGHRKGERRGKAGQIVSMGSIRGCLDGDAG